MCMYIFLYKFIVFYKIEGGANLSSKVFNEGFISLIFK